VTARLVAVTGWLLAVAAVTGWLLSQPHEPVAVTAPVTALQAFVLPDCEDEPADVACVWTDDAHWYVVERWHVDDAVFHLLPLCPTEDSDTFPCLWQNPRTGRVLAYLPVAWPPLAAP